VSWIRARFIGTCVGERLPGSSADSTERGEARRFSFELHSGRIFELETVGAPAPTDVTQPGEYRQERLRNVRFPASEDPHALPERTLFDVRIRDWQLKHPAEVGGRSYGTMEGTLWARLLPESLAIPPKLEPEAKLEPEPLQESTSASGFTSKPRFSSRSPSDHFDASRHYARLRRVFCLTAVVIVSAALALLCSLQTAGIWLAPVVVALLLRRMLRARLAGTAALQGWLAAALIAGQSYLLLEPLQTAWRMGCRVPVREDLLLIAAPVVVAALMMRGWPLFVSSVVWTGVMCAWCSGLDGTCTASSAPIRAVGPAAAGSRTDVDGRWPVMPGAPSAVTAGATAAPPAHALPPTHEGDQAGRGLRSPSPAAEAQAEGPSASGVPRLGEGVGEGAGEGVGGWVSPDHRSAARELTLISIEHANRRPDTFFRSDGQRRVYLPTDPIFDATGTRVSQAGALQLARLAALLSLHPERRVVLELHTDTGGSASTQLQTTQWRAGAVHQWLIARGHLQAAQIEAVGAGASRPLVPPDGSYAAQQPNRRIEVRLLD
jgi:outer membrane protein OmpA-like peptidoglycan-associated protein